MPSPTLPFHKASSNHHSAGSTMFSKSGPNKLHGAHIGLLATLGICLILNLAALFFSLRIITRGTQEYTYLPGDRPRELPIQVRTIQAAFHDDPDHYGMEGFIANAEWNEMRPPGKGYVFLGQERLAFGVSMWHQLHCLNHIRAVLVNGDDGSDHTAHCFHYLRQGILCAADTTLEPGGTSMKLANGDEVANGGGDVHTCRDWRQVHDWMEEQHKQWTPDMYERFKETS